MALSSEPVDLRLPRHAQPPVQADSAVDEAFASITMADLRRDASHAGRHEDRLLTPDLAETLRQQLTALNAQRRELSRLLDGLR